MGKKATIPADTAESIIARHKQAQESRNRFVTQARDAKRRLAAVQGIAIPAWEKYWEELDEWKNLIVEEEIDRELHQNGMAPTPPTTPIPRPPKPEHLELVTGKSRN
jgi:hypothetical protein